MRRGQPVERSSLRSVPALPSRIRRKRRICCCYCCYRYLRSVSISGADFRYFARIVGTNRKQKRKNENKLTDRTHKITAHLEIFFSPRMGAFITLTLSEVENRFLPLYAREHWCHYCPRKTRKVQPSKTQTRVGLDNN